MKAFEHENKDYLSIEIPEELNFKVQKSLIIGRNKKNTKKIYKNLSAVVAIFLIFFGLVNSSESFYRTIKNVPLLGSLSKSITFNWIKDSYDKGLIVKDLYKKEKDGITFKIVEVLGDKERLRIGYEIESEKELEYVSLKECNIFFNEDDRKIGAGVGIYSSFGEGVNYVFLNRDIGFINYGIIEKEVGFEFEFSYLNEDSKEIEKIIFEGNFELSDEMINTRQKQAEVNQTIKTPFIDLDIIKFVTGGTSTKLIIKTNEDFDNMKFINPIITDMEGNKLDIKIQENRKETIEGIRYIHFDAAINEENVIFKADGIDYGKNFENRITIYPKEGFIKNNNYRAEIINVDGNNFKVRMKSLEGIEFVFDDPNIKLISQEEVIVSEDSFIDLTLEIIDLNDDISSFGVDFEVKNQPIEIELNFKDLEE